MSIYIDLTAVSDFVLTMILSIGLLSLGVVGLCAVAVATLVGGIIIARYPVAAFCLLIVIVFFILKYLG